MTVLSDPHVFQKSEAGKGKFPEQNKLGKDPTLARCCTRHFPANEAGLFLFFLCWISPVSLASNAFSSGQQALLLAGKYLQNVPKGSKYTACRAPVFFLESCLSPYSSSKGPQSHVLVHLGRCIKVADAVSSKGRRRSHSITFAAPAVMPVLSAVCSLLTAHCSTALSGRVLMEYHA